MSSFDCVTNVRPDVVKGGLTGINTRTGKPMQFDGFPQYQKYVEDLRRSGNLCPEMSGTTPEKVREKNESTLWMPGSIGFLEFKPKDTKTQMRFDAISPFWEGKLASEEAISNGLYEKNTFAASRVKKDT